MHALRIAAVALVLLASEAAPTPAVEGVASRTMTRGEKESWQAQIEANRSTRKAYWAKVRAELDRGALQDDCRNAKQRAASAAQGARRAAQALRDAAMLAELSAQAAEDGNSATADKAARSAVEMAEEAVETASYASCLDYINAVAACDGRTTK